MLAFTGLYWNREDDAFDTVLVKEGQLKVDGGDDEPLLLKPFGESRFHIADKPWGDEVEMHLLRLPEKQLVAAIATYQGSRAISEALSVEP